MSDSRDDLSWVLTDFAQRVVDVDCVVLWSSDGFPRAASEGVSAEQAEDLAAMSASAFSSSKRVSAIGGGGDLSKTVIEGANRFVILALAAERTGITVCVDTAADPLIVNVELDRLLAQVGEHLVTEGRGGAGSLTGTRP
ncbi:roadblock/LC7 domain-containing protein [Saccharopolyspora flava]|uniref:Predicted regulator of Ras-like GTPase activity, Roadblock/LC7/MglB family n=1 Tax=Saccharopolyspora flava TaxID=95161 RepID=A0A1I6U859_9PSEU|nr:roadblock/LC7 domain-containing protein [Saccharopolyspora flava]SFS97646.1 Predicted regulator of Ras-like GTPase activity, Roadblock/LC7/MglB family [Saccharopolyspora flava]